MPHHIFKLCMLAIALSFTLFFSAVVMPPLIANPDVFGALAAGFVNPYASGYSTDVILCWLVLAVWIFHEARRLRVKHGWICLVLAAFPGVAVGFPVYLLLRNSQIKQLPQNQ